MDYLKKISNDLTNNLNELIQILQIHLEKDIPASDCIFEDVINSAALQLQDIIQQKNATITMDLAVTNILYPKVYLQSILYNLLSNSLKYTKPSIPPVIHVSTYENEGNCYLSVSDNGLGIDLNKFGHLLFKFQKSFHSGFDSKGIGLYLIKNQIEEQGGTIHCTSEPQIGTKFTVRF
jgi:signal transduction histidine kinase